MIRPIVALAKLVIADPRVFLRYVGVGSSAAVVELTLFVAMHQWLGWPLLVANCTALGIAVIYCFLMQRSFTFQAHGDAARHLSLYLLMQSISAILNNAIMWGLVQKLSFYPPLAKVLQIGMIFLWNYTFARLVVFAPPRSRADSAP